jgi:hypothetical protein
MKFQLEKHERKFSQTLGVEVFKLVTIQNLSRINVEVVTVCQLAAVENSVILCMAAAIQAAQDPKAAITFGAVTDKLRCKS